MNPFKSLFLTLLLAMGTAAYAQKVPIKYIRFKFPEMGQVSTAALQRNIELAIRQSGITATAQLASKTVKADLTKSVFQAYPQGQPDDFPLSGFIFKTTYQGKEEIFGVIAQHAMPLSIGGGGEIRKSFTARVVQNGQVADIPAEVVQTSASSTTDIALVKFRPEDEELLAPLTLAQQEPALNEPLTLMGFTGGPLTLITDSPLQEISLFSLRFPLAGYALSGLCGSPVLNEAGEVVGTMTGATPNKIVVHTNSAGETTVTEKTARDTGYATRNLYLRSLVAAYHGEAEEALFPLMLGGEKIVDLRPDEFVSWIIFKDENGKAIFRKGVDRKFPYSAVTEHLPGTRYIELYIENAWWSGFALIEGGNILSARRVVYDLKEKKIIYEKPHKNSNF